MSDPSLVACRQEGGKQRFVKRMTEFFIKNT